MKARITISLKPDVLDPQGRAVERALAADGFAEVSRVRIGKVVEVDLDEIDPAAARARVEAMCERLLANPVLERWDVEIG